jgi:putative PIN family toxin of toxin-antitoxin system
MQIAVFDTNVLLDLFVFNDFRAIHLKQALLDKKIDAIATPRTLEEFADVLSRPLFSLTTVDQKKILQQWTSLARILDDKNIVQSPWKCQDPDDQVFLDLAYTARPCTLISKDNEVLKFANTALTDGVLITANYQALEF